eukprot:10958556-Ditylum_brightwellii.AAC.1
MEEFAKQGYSAGKLEKLNIIAIYWAQAQQEYFKELVSRRSGRRFVAALIQKLWDTSWDFWQH